MNNFTHQIIGWSARSVSLCLLTLGSLAFGSETSKINFDYKPAPLELNREELERMNQTKIGDLQVKELVSGDQVTEMCQRLYDKIKKDRFMPSLIIGLARGGLVPLAHLAGENCFDMRNVISLSVQSYEGMHQGEIKLTMPLPSETIAAHTSILLLDDIVDTGATFNAAVELIQDCAPDACLKTASLFYKSKRSIVKPDYFEQDTDEWVVFPWEKCEKPLMTRTENGRTFGYFLKK